MLGSSVLEIALGMVFIYLFLSIIITTLNETIATFFALRAHNLENGIRTLLQDDDFRTQVANGIEGIFWTLRHKYKGKLLIPDARISEVLKIAPPSTVATETGAKPESTLKKGVATQVYAHGLISSLSRRGSLPSYIPSRTFASALYDILLKANTERPNVSDPLESLAEQNARVFGEMREAIPKIAPPRLREALLAILSEAENDTDKTLSAAEKMRTRLEQWYDDSMDRISGWYKRNLQNLTYVLSLALVLSINADTVRIVRELDRNVVLRNSLAKAAERVGQTTGNDSSTANFATMEATLNAEHVTLPFGYSGRKLLCSDEEAEKSDKKSDKDKTTEKSDKGRKSDKPDPGKTTDKKDACSSTYWLTVPFPEILTKIAGLFLTTVAISLGAPFWFDILNRFVCVRGTGTTPDESDRQDHAVGKSLG